MADKNKGTVHIPGGPEYVYGKLNTAYVKKGKANDSTNLGKATASDISRELVSDTTGKHALASEDGTISFGALKGTDRIEAMKEELQEGMMNLTLDQDEFKKFMNFVGTNYSFSARNQMLLHMQKPGGNVFKTAKQWSALGYQVGKGTRAAFAYRPYLRKEQKLDESGNPVIGEDGKPMEEMHLMGYGTTPYFSERDLDESVKTPPKHPLQNHFTRYLTRDDIDDVSAMREDLTKVAESMNIPVVEKNKQDDPTLAGGAGGYARKTPDGYEIVLSTDAQPHAVTHILSHEMAHILCGHLDKEDTRDYKTTEGRSAQEVEAESMAYIISKDYGLDTDNFAFSYLKGYAKDDPEKITQAMTNVSKGVKKYYSSLEKIVTGTNQEEINAEANKINAENYKKRKKTATKKRGRRAKK